MLRHCIFFYRPNFRTFFKNLWIMEPLEPLKMVNVHCEVANIPRDYPWMTQISTYLPKRTEEKLTFVPVITDGLYFEPKKIEIMAQEIEDERRITRLTWAISKLSKLYVYNNMYLTTNVLE